MAIEVEKSDDTDRLKAGMRLGRPIVGMMLVDNGS